MVKPLQPLGRPPSLHRSVQATIKNYIAENRLRAGDALPPETELARQLGVSRTSVREAVKALESLGVLETRRGDGLYVAEFSFAPLLDNLSYGLMVDLRELGELLEVRRALETALIEKALAALTPDHLQRLRAIVAAMRERADRGQPLVQEDREFHQALFEGLGNATLLKLLDVFWLAFRRAADEQAVQDTDPARTYRDHVAILDALAARDAARARAALDGHYAGLQRRLDHAQRLRPDEPLP